MKITCGVAIFDKNNNLLIGQATNSNNWSIPKGLNENNETFEETAIREVFEETGLTLDKNKLQLIGREVYPNNKKELILFFIKLDNINLNSLICNSFFEFKGHQFPEINKFELVNNESYKFFNIHKTQINLINNNILWNK